MLKIQQPDLEGLRRHGEETYPNECCGVLVGRLEGEERRVSSIARCGNTRNDSPRNRYNIDPQELIRVQREARERGEDVVGFFASGKRFPVISLFSRFLRARIVTGTRLEGRVA